MVSYHLLVINQKLRNSLKKFLEHIENRGKREMTNREKLYLAKEASARFPRRRRKPTSMGSSGFDPAAAAGSVVDAVAAPFGRIGTEFRRHRAEEKKKEEERKQLLSNPKSIGYGSVLSPVDGNPEVTPEAQAELDALPTPRSMYLKPRADGSWPTMTAGSRGGEAAYEDYANLSKKDGYAWEGDNHGVPGMNSQHTRPGKSSRHFEDSDPFTPMMKYLIPDGKKPDKTEPFSYQALDHRQNPWVHEKRRMHTQAHRNNPEAYEAWRNDPKNTPMPEGIKEFDTDYMQSLAKWQHGMQRHNEIKKGDPGDRYRSPKQREKEWQQKHREESQAGIQKALTAGREENSRLVKAPKGHVSVFKDVDNIPDGMTTYGEQQAFYANQKQKVIRDKELLGKQQKIDEWAARSPASKWYDNMLGKDFDDPHMNPSIAAGKKQRYDERSDARKWAENWVSPAPLVEGVGGIINDGLRVGSAAIGATEGKGWGESTAWMEHSPETQSSFTSGVGQLAYGLGTDPLGTLGNVAFGEGGALNLLGGAGVIGKLKGVPKGVGAVPKAPWAPRPMFPVRGGSVLQNTVNASKNLVGATRNTANTVKNSKPGRFAKHYRKAEDVADPGLEGWDLDNNNLAYNDRDSYNPAKTIAGWLGQGDALKDQQWAQATPGAGTLSGQGLGALAPKPQGRALAGEPLNVPNTSSTSRLSSPAAAPVQHKIWDPRPGAITRGKGPALAGEPLKAPQTTTAPSAAAPEIPG
jgi:hypothetical protein